MTIYTGDCIEVMQTLDPDSVDAIVTDPPYGLEFMGKEWDRQPIFQAWCEAWGRAALRVTKPGGYLLAFGGTRTHHRLVCGLEDAGWIIRDELDWIYASGFPKGKANLKPAHEPIVLARKPGPLRPLAIDACRIGYISAADSADVAGKVSKNPTGKAGLYGVPGVATFNGGGRWPSNVLLSDPALFDTDNPDVVGSGAVPHSQDPETRASGGKGIMFGSIVPTNDGAGYGDSGGYSRFFGLSDPPIAFIVPKADRADREPVLRGQLEAVEGQVAIQHGGKLERWPDGHLEPRKTPMPQRENSHPTVKPVDLMRHLVRLVTPVGGTVLDCFLGSGSTVLAAELEGFAWIGIEKEAEYVAIAQARLNGVQKGMGL